METHPIKTKLEIIEELFDDGYVKDPSLRSIVPDTYKCFYKLGENNCAVGKCMKPEKYREEFEKVGVVTNFTGKSEVETGDIQGPLLDTLLKDEYKGHTLEFWRELQCLHDSPRYWKSVEQLGNYQFTNEGISELARLKEKYK